MIHDFGGFTKFLIRNRLSGCASRSDTSREAYLSKQYESVISCSPCVSSSRRFRASFVDGIDVLAGDPCKAALFIGQCSADRILHRTVSRRCLPAAEIAQPCQGKPETTRHWF